MNYKILRSLVVACYRPEMAPRLLIATSERSGMPPRLPVAASGRSGMPPRLPVVISDHSEMSSRLLIAASDRPEMTPRLPVVASGHSGMPPRLPVATSNRSLGAELVSLLRAFLAPVSGLIPGGKPPGYTDGGATRRITLAIMRSFRRTQRPAAGSTTDMTGYRQTSNNG
jgi:hypothetical protein